MSETVKEAQLAGAGRSASFIDIYSNQIRLNVSTNDFALTFGVLDDHGPAGHFLKDEAVVRFAPGNAKSLLINLQAAVAAFETACGKIVINPRNEEAARQLEINLTKLLAGQLAG